MNGTESIGLSLHKLNEQQDQLRENNLNFMLFFSHIDD